MAQLADLKAKIDKGKTAKLFYPMNRPGGVEITVRIKKGQHEGVDCYIWQHKTTGHMVYPTHNPLTDFYPEWEQLLQGIKGEQLETSGWQITDEPLEPYLPPPSKVVPAPPHMSFFVLKRSLEE